MGLGRINTIFAKPYTESIIFSFLIWSHGGHCTQGSIWGDVNSGPSSGRQLWPGSVLRQPAPVTRFSKEAGRLKPGEECPGPLAEMAGSWLGPKMERIFHGVMGGGFSPAPSPRARGQGRSFLGMTQGLLLQIQACSVTGTTSSFCCFCSHQTSSDGGERDVIRHRNRASLIAQATQNFLN